MQSMEPAIKYSSKSLLLYFILGAWCYVYAEREYAVTILADPPNDPYPAGSGNIQFTCIVDPLPPETVTYQWKILDYTYGRQTTGQNMTFYPYYNNLRFSWFFCHVYSNSTLVSIGHRMVEIHGLFSSLQTPVVHFVPGDDLTLTTRDLSQYYSRYINSVSWSHNGTELSYGGRYTISSNSNLYERELNITDLRSSDAGMYQMRINSLSIYGSQDPVCDSLMIPLAENHAALAPVTFFVRESTECKIKEYNSSLLHPPIPTYYYIDESKLIVEETIHIPDSWNASTLLGISSPRWFHNGETISSSEAKYNTSNSIIGGGAIRSTLIITNVTEGDTGLYTVLLSIDTYSLLYGSLVVDCRRGGFYYADFFIHYLSLYDISLGIIDIKVEKYEPPVINFSVSQSSIEGDSLQCRVEGGNPSVYPHNITLTRNGVNVAQTSGDHLSYNIPPNMFGVYTCVVESLHSTDNKTLLIRQGTTFQVLLDANTASKCEPSFIEGQDVNSIIMSILAVIEDQCNCSLSVDNFEGSHLSCLGYGPNAIFTSTLVYSDSEGEVLASDLVAMFQSQLEARDGQTLMGTSFVIPSGRQSTCGGVIAGGFVGGWIVGLLTLALAIGIGVCILKVKTNMLIQRERNSPQRQAAAYATSEDMKMATLEIKPNTAYEAVKVRQQNRGASGGHQETVSDEPVYDFPEP